MIKNPTKFANSPFPLLSPFSLPSAPSAVKKINSKSRQFQKYNSKVINLDRPPSHPKTPRTMADKNIVEKIKKLLALATSSNENESTAAAEKASLLLAQYNLSLADLGPNHQEEIDETDVETTSKFVTWKMILLSGIAEANCCNAMRNSYTGSMFLVGTSTNLIVCKHLYEYLNSAIERRAKYRKGNGRGLAYLNAFRVGCATRLRQRLLEQKQEMERSGIPGEGNAAATPGIVVRSMFERNQQAIFDYLESKGAKVRTRSGAQISSEAGYNSGYEVGDRISLNKQVQSEGEMKQLNESL